MKNKSVVIVDMNDRRRRTSSPLVAGGQGRGIEMLVQTLESRSISVARARTAAEAIKLIGLVRPDLLLIDPSIPDGFGAADYASIQGIEVIVMTESDSVLHRARSRGISRAVIKGEGWDTVMDAVFAYFGEEGAAAMDSDARILVVDAAREVAELISKFLSGRGFSVVPASTGIECMDILETDPSIGVVVLDIILPEIGGMEILEALSRWQSPPSVIVMSAIGDRSMAANARRLGAFDFMTKPIDLYALETNIVACLAHSEYRAQSWWKRVISGYSQV